MQGVPGVGALIMRFVLFFGFYISLQEPRPRHRPTHVRPMQSQAKIRSIGASILGNSRPQGSR